MPSDSNVNVAADFGWSEGMMPRAILGVELAVRLRNDARWFRTISIISPAGSAAKPASRQAHGKASERNVDQVLKANRRPERGKPACSPTNIAEIEPRPLKAQKRLSHDWATKPMYCLNE